MKMKKTIAGLVAAGIAATLTTPVFADGPVEGGTQANPIKASITKVLETGETTTTPNATFTFKFEQQKGVTTDSEGNPIETIQKDAKIGPVTAKTTSRMTGTEANDKKTVEVESADFLKDVDFPNAGIYVYKVTEEQSGYTIADPTKESLVYSQAEYTVYIYVANGDNNETYVQAIGTVFTKDDSGKQDGDDGVDPNVGSKVDPTPNPNPGTNGAVNANNSEMKFTNKYIKTPGNDPDPDPTDPDKQMLSVGKTVTGDLGDKTKFFDFSITLNKLAVQDEEQEYTGYIVDADNNPVTGTDLPNGQNNEVSFTTGTAKTVKLKDGQKIVFPEVPVGTHFTATETTVAEYKPSAQVTQNGTVITTKDVKVTSSDAASSGVKGASNVIVGENKSGVQVTNKYNDTTPTGILLNNKPAFIAMIVAIAGGVVAVIVGAKFKKNRVR